MRVSIAGSAWLGNAGTFHDYRRRGLQRALLSHRLDEAVGLGCEWAVADTRFGTTSHRNVERAGMAMVFLVMTLQQASS